MPIPTTTTSTVTTAFASLIRPPRPMKGKSRESFHAISFAGGPPIRETRLTVSRSVIVRSHECEREVAGQRGRVGAAGRPRRLLQARRALQVGRPHLHPHLGARARGRAP